jgi:hypothetical protein
MSSVSDLTVLSYSEKAWVVYGNTKENKNVLKTLGGKYNPHLAEALTRGTGKGWIFPKSRFATIEALQSAIETTIEFGIVKPRTDAEDVRENEESQSGCDESQSSESFPQNVANTNTDLLLQILRKLVDIEKRLDKMGN